ncbi:MAG TPA: extracellular solute-binding protein [Firmicutes bacterium]|nr:extracellular solute-binding protein [Bacillota bacterium]
MGSFLGVVPQQSPGKQRSAFQGKLICFLAFVVVSLCLFGLGAEARPKLTVVMSASAVDDNERAVSRFAAMHDVDIEIVSLPSGTLRRIEFIVTRFLGGLDMDITHITPEMAGALMKAGVAVDLQPFISKDPSLRLSDFVPAALDTYRMLTGEVYALPMDIALRGLIANLDAINDAGLAHPNNLTPDDWNWTRFMEYARKLTRYSPSGEVERYGIRWAPDNVDTLILQAGGYEFDHPTAPTKCGILLPQTIQALETWTSWFHPNPIATHSGSEDVASGKAAMGIHVSSHIDTFVDAKLLFSWDVVRYPKGPANNGHVETISAFMMTSNSKNPELAWKLLSFLVTDREAALYLLRSRARPSGYIPNLEIYNRSNFVAGAPPGVDLYREMVLNPFFKAKSSFPGAADFIAKMRDLLVADAITGKRSILDIATELDHFGAQILSELK